MSTLVGAARSIRRRNKLAASISPRCDLRVGVACVDVCVWVWVAVACVGVCVRVLIAWMNVCAWVLVLPVWMNVRV